MSDPAEAFANAYIAAVKAGGAFTEPKRAHAIWGRLSAKALEFARDHFRREKAGEKLEPVAQHAARYLASWAYEHEHEFAAVANSINKGDAWRFVWTPACAAAIEASRAARAAGQGGGAA